MCSGALKGPVSSPPKKGAEQGTLSQGYVQVRAHLVEAGQGSSGGSRHASDALGGVAKQRVISPGEGVGRQQLAGAVPLCEVLKRARGEVERSLSRFANMMTQGS
jgi:hypothetical protein